MDVMLTPLDEMVASTGTPLDTIMQGLYVSQMHLISGPPIWTTRMSAAIVYGSRTRWKAIHWISRNVPPGVSEIVQVSECSMTMSSLIEHVRLLRVGRDDLVVIDDVGDYDKDQWSLKAIALTALFNHLRGSEVSLILAGNERQDLGKSALFSASLILSLREVAKNAEGDDSLIEVVLQKSRTMPTPRTMYLWMDPSSTEVTEA